MTTITEPSPATTTQVVYRDPKALVANPANVRSELGKVTDLAQSIAAIGVLEPIILVPTEDGGEAILAGHRRTAAAIEAGLDQVPCIIRPDLASGVESVTAMLVENLRRKDLSATETARAYEQLVGFGLSPAVIARRTGSKPKDVREHLVVAESELAAAAGERFEFLTMAHLLVLAEFEDDPDAVRDLTVTAKKDPEYFEHRASQLRQARVYQAKLAAVTTQLTEAGVRIVDEPGYSERSPMRRLHLLVTEKGKELTEATHAACEGHVATLSSYDPERVTYWCSDPKAYGHKERYASEGRPPSSATRGEDGKLTEEARTERRRIIDNNKAMDAANPVRRKFIVNLVARKVAVKGGLRFAVRDLVGNAHQMSGDDGLLAAFLGVDASRVNAERTTGSAAVDRASDVRLPNVLLAHCATAIESTWTKEAWRSVDTRKAAWLGFLNSQGYRIAEVEQLIVDDAAKHSEGRRAVVTVVADALGTVGAEGRDDPEDLEEGTDAEEDDPDPDVA